MRWVLAGVFTFLLAAAGALFAVPRMVDWNAYRPDIASLVQGMTGRQLVIDGDVRLVLLPTPTLSASGVRLRNMQGAAAPDMIRLKSLDARVSLAPLLKGRVVVESMVLVEPDVVLERLPDGRPNWQFLRPPSMDFVDDVGDDLEVNRLIVVGGTVSVANAGRIERITGINAEITAERLAGPIRVQGDLTWRGMAWRADLSTGRFAPFHTTQISATLGLRGGGSEARFTGAATLAANRPIVSGSLRADLARFRDILAALELPLPAELAQRTNIEATVTLDEDRLAFDALTVRIADARITGAAAIPVSSAGVGEATLKVGLIDLDKWPATPPSDPAGAPVEVMATLKALSRVAPGKWSIQGEGLRLRDTLLRDWRVVAEVTPGSVLLREASGHLPGGTDLVFYGIAGLGEAPSFKGAVEFGTEAIRQPWAWLGLPLPPAEPDRLRQASLTANLSVAADGVAVDDLKLRLDGSRIAGAVGVRLGGARPSVSAALTLDTVNLGAYWPSGLPVSAETAAVLRRLDIVLALRTGPVTFGETAVNSIDLQAELRDGALSIARGALALNDDRVNVQGNVSNAADPALDLTASGAIADVRPWLRLIGVDAPQADLGPLSGRLNLNGTVAAPKVKSEISLEDGGTKIAGGITFGPALEIEISASAMALPRPVLRLAPELGLIADVTKPAALEVKATRTPTGWKIERGELGIGPGRIAANGNWTANGLDADLSLQGFSATASTVAASIDRLKSYCCGVGEALEGTLRLSLGAINLAGMAVDEASGVVAFAAGGWSFTEATVKLWNGAAALEGSPWKPEGMKIAARGLDVGVMSSLIGMERRLAGRLAGVAQVAVDPASGRLVGVGRVAVQGLVLPGLDLVSAVSGLDMAPPDPLGVDRAATAFGKSLAEGSAGPGFLQARIRLGVDEIRLEDGSMQTPGLLGALEGAVSLATQKLEGQATLRTTRSVGFPPVSVRIAGAPDRPIMREDLAALKSFLASRSPQPAPAQIAPASGG